MRTPGQSRSNDTEYHATSGQNTQSTRAQSRTSWNVLEYLTPYTRLSRDTVARLPGKVKVTTKAPSGYTKTLVSDKESNWKVFCRSVEHVDGVLRGVQLGFLSVSGITSEFPTITMLSHTSQVGLLREYVQSSRLEKVLVLTECLKKARGLPFTSFLSIKLPGYSGKLNHLQPNPLGPKLRIWKLKVEL